MRMIKNRDNTFVPDCECNYEVGPDFRPKVEVVIIEREMWKMLVDHIEFDLQPGCTMCDKIHELIKEIG